MFECENESIIVEYEYAARDASPEEPTFTIFWLAERGDGGSGVLFFFEFVFVYDKSAWKFCQSGGGLPASPARRASALRSSQGLLLLKPHSNWFSKKHGYCGRSEAIRWKNWYDTRLVHPPHFLLSNLFPFLFRTPKNYRIYTFAYVA
jgi:hypothetical protein